MSTVLSGTFEGDLVACRPDLYRTARKLFGNRYDADDAVQSVCVRAFERRHQFLGGCMACWLHRILANVFNDEKRRSKRLVFTGDPTYADQIVCHSDTHASLEACEGVKAVAARPDGDILVQAGLGASTEELAEQFGLSAANVRQTLSRGRRALRERDGKPDRLTEREV